MARDCRNAKSECKTAGLSKASRRLPGSFDSSNGQKKNPPEQGKRGCATATVSYALNGPGRDHRQTAYIRSGGISDVKLNSKNISVMEETSHSAAELNLSHGLSVKKNWQ